MNNQTLHLAKKYRDYWIGRAQELQSNSYKLADEIIEFTQQEVKNCSIPDVRQQSELLKAFLKWRLDKPHSDFQTQDYDIGEFLKAFNCA